MLFLGERHLLHGTVTGGATNALLNVNAVVEKNEIGNFVDPIPFDWRVGGPALADRFQDGSIGPHLRMAGHAGFGGRNAGESGIFDADVAITAINSEAGYVMFMAEGNGLVEGHTFPGHVG